MLPNSATYFVHNIFFWSVNNELQFYSHSYGLFRTKLQTILRVKQTISTALMMENPVSNPIVPPMEDILSSGLATVSWVILSNVGVSKQILTILSLFFHSYSWKGLYVICNHVISNYNAILRNHLTFQSWWKLKNTFVIFIVRIQFRHKFLTSGKFSIYLVLNL